MGWSSSSNRKLENFSKALKNLEDSTSYQPPFDVVTEAGLVSLFQICMEQSWKAMKYALDDLPRRRPSRPGRSSSAPIPPG